MLTKEGLYPGITYPRAPGHEVAGVIDETVQESHTGGKAARGVGWHGGSVLVYLMQARRLRKLLNLKVTGSISTAATRST